MNDNSINLGEIDVSKIDNMAYLFYESERTDFSGIENWNVSNVKNMSGMFLNATSFNQDLSKWNVSEDKYKKGIFEGSPLAKNPPVWYRIW